ncbi:hypothetical protein Pan181_25710 [Aeoliella mucimassa]|uniref:Beta-galactosidase n=2 Tax=Aeoliella mucimassa TaxID=2527972 RepID=A0A518ANR4_9BACT|nr:hypothetical protein Pan181_25710 [Aeoliella mucimassa]
MIRTKLQVLIALPFLIVTLLPAARGDNGSGYVWLEAEKATNKRVTYNNWYDDVKKDSLSGGSWLTNFDNNKQGTAELHFSIDKAGDYTFWLRANPVKSHLSYQIDDGDWQDVDFSLDTRGQMNIASNDQPDLRFIAWVKIGNVELSEGQHSLALRMDSELSNHGGIDCAVFTSVPFIPSGITKPVAMDGPAEPDEWFPVMMDVDPLSPKSIIDVSALIDAPAGKHGFLKRDKDAMRFENDQQPSKFWGVGAHPLGNTPEQMDATAAWFRKHGINMVRQHTVINAVGLFDDQGKLDPERVDRYDRWFAALKQQGIYSTWSVVYPHHGVFLRSEDLDDDLFAELDAEDASRDGTKEPIVSNDYINIDRRIQDVAWKYFEAMLNHKNPYTGLAYKDDPALAVMEVQNESNVFFYTFNSLVQDGKMPGLSRDMRKRFHDFVIKKYGSQEDAVKTWGRSMKGDDWQQGELELMGAYHWGSDGPLYEYAGQDRRCGDYIEFLTDVQREYYERRIQQMRDAGFQGVTVTTAWRSGGPGASLANLYCDAAGDSIDRHNYFGGGEGGHRIMQGNVNTKTHLGDPGLGLLSVGMFQVGDHPFSYSEWSHMPPNPWKAEAAPLVAFYGLGLQGWDASYHFMMNDTRIGDGWPKQSKYVTNTPHYIGQFPALAFAIYNGHIAQADTIALRRATSEEMFAGRDVLGQSLAGGEHDAKELVGKGVTPPAALAAGRVTIEFEEGESEISGFESLHDVEAKTIRSTTGELVWRYGERIVEVRSPKTQGVIGFAENQVIRLPSVAVKTSTPFVSLLFTPLDNAELKDSKHILITAMAREKQTGSEFNDDWSQLINEGRPPLLMEPVQSLVLIAGDKPKSVRPVDLYGVPRDELLPVNENGTFKIDGTWRTYYYEVIR